MLSVVHRRRQLLDRPEPFICQGFRLRTYAGDQDIPLWLSLRDRAFARQKLGVRQWSVEDFHREFLEKPWWRPDWLWFAERSGQDGDSTAAGTVALALRSGETDVKPVVHWLCVVPAWRRQSIGRVLMSAVERAAWDAGYDEVWLETHAAWKEAAAFYDRLNYTVVER